MSRKFSLAYLTIPGTAPVDQIRIAKEAGYDFVSLRTIPMHLPGEPEFLLHKDAKLFEETRQALKEYDMPVMDIELARVRPDLDINEYDPAFEKAAELGATDVLGSIWTRDKAYYIDQVAKIAEMAKKYGLKYNVEFLPWAGVRNLQEAITLVEHCEGGQPVHHGGHPPCRPRRCHRCRAGPARIQILQLHPPVRRPRRARRRPRPGQHQGRADALHRT